MTDKVQKIRAYIEKLHKEHRGGEGDSIFRKALRTVLFYIDSLQEEPVSEDLEEAIDTYLATYFGGEKEKQDWPFIKKMAIHFAQWQKKQLMASGTHVTVHVDAGGYPYIPQIELYDYDKDIPLAKEGDRYKVILIKED